MSARRFARELALQALFEVEIGHRAPAEALKDVLARHDAQSEDAFAGELVLGTLEHCEESERVIAPLLQGWALDRLPTIDRILLRMAVYELHHSPLAPAIVINEAVELAKKFSTQDSGRYLNGVLATVARARA